MDILIFKTDIEKEKSASISSLLNKVNGIRNWSIDHEDIDKVLRVEADKISENDIIDVVSTAGFHCEELTW